jgi:hypothetical protein
MDAQSEKVISHYAEAYQQLYKRTPKDVRILGNGWVSVNGAKMRVSELEYLTIQLKQEYSQGQIIEQRRNIVNRLLKWFKQ